ncbi:MAG: hypothetical protein NVSMB60_34860 [Mycobacterium sp.]
MSGLLVQAQGFFPRRPYEALSRLFGVETQFLGDVDTAARAAYEERARAS